MSLGAGYQLSNISRRVRFQDPFAQQNIVDKQFLEYEIKLKHANDLPVVNLGSQEKAIYVPAELCTIEPMQHYAGRMGERETAAIIKFALKRPSATAKSIVTTGLPALAFTPELLGYPMKEFGITIGSDMTVIPGRELPPPRLTYKSGPQSISDGTWNVLNSQFHHGATVTSWWLFVVRDANVPDKISDNKDPRLRMLVERFRDKCTKCGMNFPKSLPDLLFSEQLPPLRDDPFRERAVNMIRGVITQKLKSGRKPSFILVLLSSFDNYIYPGIKRIGDVEVGVHTVHMLISKAFRDDKKQDQYLSNITLKLNTKLGGINHLLDQDAMKWLRTKKTMIVGMDVTHPGRNSVPGTPSIAAVVASVDDSMVQFPASMKPQDSQDVKEVCIPAALTGESF
jgi:eukaryotic translation initiation factor 2C